VVTVQVDVQRVSPACQKHVLVDGEVGGRNGIAKALLDGVVPAADAREKRPLYVWNGAVWRRTGVEQVVAAHGVNPLDALHQMARAVVILAGAVASGLTALSR